MQYKIVLLITLILSLTIFSSNTFAAENSEKKFFSSGISSLSQDLKEIDSRAKDIFNKKIVPIIKDKVEERINNWQKKVLTGGLLSYATSYVGVPYVWGGNTPRGFDCAGFVQFVFHYLDIDLPKTADYQYLVGERVKYLEPGDAVFFGRKNCGMKGITHVAIYEGEDKIIHSTSSRGVRITRLRADSYFGPRYVGAKRFLDLN